MQISRITAALILTVLAGLSTTIGALIVFIFKSKSYKNLSFFMSMAAGVMISVSFVKIFYESVNSFAKNLNPRASMLMTVYSFFGGMLLCYLIDKFIPEDIEYAKTKGNKSLLRGSKGDGSKNQRTGVYEKRNTFNVYRTGLISTIAIILHNIPEGVATFVSAMTSFKIAIPIAIAIAIHNIPEGIAVATPIYYSTKSKGKAFKYTFLSGMSEPFGALLGYIILEKFVNDNIFGITFGMVSGIMVYISFNNLLPLAYSFADDKKTILNGIIMGIAIMLTSVVMFG